MLESAIGRSSDAARTRLGCVCTLPGRSRVSRKRRGRFRVTLTMRDNSHVISKAASSGHNAGQSQWRFSRMHSDWGRG